jgi:uncharacterized protein
MPALHRTIYEKSVFVDTGPLYALFNKKDNYNQKAQSCLESIRKDKLPIYVSNITIIETHKRLLFDLGYAKAIEFLVSIYDGSIPIVRLAEEDEHEAKRILLKFSDQDFSLYDAINFSIMKRIGISKAFTFDSHFKTFGFEKIPEI